MDKNNFATIHFKDGKQPYSSVFQWRNSRLLPQNLPEPLFNLYSVPWINPFPRPQPGQQLIVVERPRSVVTLERGCTRVSTSLYYTANVEHMESRCLVRKMFGQAVEAKLIQR
ncbi:hypothetical protein ACFX15_003272 [Malus domestica]